MSRAGGRSRAPPKVPGARVGLLPVQRAVLRAEGMGVASNLPVAAQASSTRPEPEGGVVLSRLTAALWRTSRQDSLAGNEGPAALFPVTRGATRARRYAARSVTLIPNAPGRWSCYFG